MAFSNFQKKFPTEEAAVLYIMEKKFPDGQYVCPRCGCVHDKIYHQKHNVKFFWCGNCKTEFSLLTGTIFAYTRIDLRVWLWTINEMLIARKSISTLQAQRIFGLGYAATFRMIHKIREAIGKDNVGLLKDIAAIDETYIGGNPRRTTTNHKRGRGTSKTPVIGIKERAAKKVIAEVANKNENNQRLSGKLLYDILYKNCEEHTAVMTGLFNGYDILDKRNGKNFMRKVINHDVGFAEDDAYTNGMESFGCY